MLRNVVTTAVPTEDSFEFSPWTITTVKNHILPSRPASDSSSNDPYAAYHELSIPHLPDMVFADNLLRIQHKNGSGLEFNALEALKLVNDHEDLVKVAVAEAWKEARYYKQKMRKYSFTVCNLTNTCDCMQSRNGECSSSKPSF